MTPSKTQAAAAAAGDGSATPGVQRERPHCEGTAHRNQNASPSASIRDTIYRGRPFGIAARLNAIVWSEGTEELGRQ
jgi:hypothetical protein